MPGASVVAYPCFLMGSVVDVEFTRYDTDYDGILFINGSSDIWPEPVYWMLSGEGQDKAILFFSADGSLARVAWSTLGRETDGTISPISTSLGYLTHYPESSLGEYRLAIGYTGSSDSYIPALFATYNYFSGTQSEIDAFFETARLIAVGDQLYVVGEV